ncbi:MerR family transcriptional regulator [Hydrocarboniphaga effusa]|uniref:MerR family transcriptional regulator n=2 Tax=Hydrocarboniphaga effusa TaxID=243629 RepID=UPI00398BDD49
MVGIQLCVPRLGFNFLGSSPSMNMPRKSLEKPHSTEAPRCPINVAARRAGLTAHVIRAWERRYEAIVPERTAKGRRLYSEWEIQRLVLLRQAVDLGHRISEIADLPLEDLRALVGQDAVPGVEASPRIPMTTNRLIELAMDMVRGLDGPGLSQSLLQATRTLTGTALFDDFVAPLSDELLRRRRQGELRLAHEQFAMAYLRRFVGDLLSTKSVHSIGATVLVCAPVSSLHEIGALASAVTANREGWQVVYLGVGLPADEIAFVAERRHARAVIVSLSGNGDDDRVESELSSLRNRLDTELPVIVVGRDAERHRSTLQSIGARSAITQTELTAELEHLAHPAADVG